MKEELELYFIMGSQNCQDKDPEDILEQALEAGITMFQLREKGEGAATGQEKRQLAERLQARCRAHSIPFIVNDDVDLAIAIGADGVHIGQTDEAMQQVKTRCPEHFIIGVSAQNAEEAKKAIQDGAHYIGVGPIAATRTKIDAKFPIGLTGLREIRKQVGDFPMVAIGGINQKNAEAVRQAGADGISFISVLTKATDIQQAVNELKMKMEKMHT
ncbi:thiamine phosphate synthase [Terribacillus saccharophilus]|uniref:thiamine phosphate synthase n=1 Tax=Terribacillus saccharophilus TaxID=361277 RepID=UPI002DCB41D7|nr:thiamine phosphate synthase [Terribacillus saccharophilus]MEC0289678.1 thiamine phosphate synthase [Terribacillus saccharophilus]MEC0301488.1 thiamine phosphate synthase [Terribacillus saccharophilus]